MGLVKWATGSGCASAPKKVPERGLKKKDVKPAPFIGGRIPNPDVYPYDEKAWDTLTREMARQAKENAKI